MTKKGNFMGKQKKKLHKIATEKQIDMLSFIKDKCDVKFKGETSKDVYDFIGEWYPRALKMANIEQAIGQMGVTTYRATKRYHGNDVHGEWEETVNLKDTIAHEIFKGEIMRGRNPVDALCDFQERALPETLLRTEDDYDYDDYDEERDLY